jgi:glycine/D-amino acid oxidase-like deaminating enzyme
VDDILPHAWEAYQELGQALSVTAISEKNVIDFFPNPFMREGFLKKIETGDKYVHPEKEQNNFADFFNYEFGYGEIAPAYTAHLETILPAWRQQLVNRHQLVEDKFDITLLQTSPDNIRYKDITASKIIFCDGNASFENPFFNKLPFAPNKGEALVVEIPGLPTENIYKKSMMLVPMVDKDIFWIGSSYLWEFDNAAPSAIFKENTAQLLKHWLKIPFTIVEHRSGLRPATLERRPFVGLHPLHPSVGILNGMGTKGCSLAPYFAKQLCTHLFNQQPISPDADVKRFTKILEKK